MGRCQAALFSQGTSKWSASWSLAAILAMASVAEASAAPLVSEEIDLAEPWYGSAGNSQRAPALGWGENQGLVVWVDSRSYWYSLVATRLSRASIPQDPVGISLQRIHTAESGPIQLELAWSDGSYLIAWVSDDLSTSDDHVEALILDSQGQIKASGLLKFPASSSSLAIASGEQIWLVAWIDPMGSVTACRVDALGQVLDDPPLLVSETAKRPAGLDLGWDDLSFFLVWEDDDQLLGARISSDGLVSLLPGPGLWSGNIQEGPRIAWTGSNYLLAWTERIGQEQTNRLRLMRIAADGGWIDILPRELTGRAAMPSLSCGSDHCLVVWEEISDGSVMLPASDTRGAIVLEDYSIFEVELSPDWHENFRYQPTVAWTGEEYVVAWADNRQGWFSDIYSTSVSPQGEVADDSGVVLSLGHSSQIQPTSAFDGEDFMAAFIESRSGTGPDVVGVLLNPTENSTVGPSMVLESGPLHEWDPQLGWTGERYLLLWCDYRNFPENMEAFVTRLDANGLPLDPARPVTGSCRPNSIACSPNICLIPTVRWDSMEAVTIDMQAASLAEEVLPLHVPSIRAASAAACWGDGVFLVVWLNCTYEYDMDCLSWELRAARLAEDGTVLGPSSFLVAPGGNLGSPRLSWDENSFLVVWTNRAVDNSVRVMGARVGPDGNVLDPEGFHIAGPAESLYLYATVWGGMSHLVSWSIPSDLDLKRIEAIRVGSDGALIDDSPFSVLESRTEDEFYPFSNQVLSSDGAGRWLYLYHRFHDDSPEPLFRGHGRWIEALMLGRECGEGVQCDSGLCMDRVCCDAPCQGQCEACDRPGLEGTCGPVSGQPRGNRPGCIGEPPCGGTCSGVDAAGCAYPGQEVLCSTGFCRDGVQVDPAACDGTGMCPEPGLQPCPPYSCETDTCRTDCSTDEHCATGFSCLDGACRQEVDAGEDAGPDGDGGADLDLPPSDGCSCGHTNRGTAACLLLLVLLGAIRRR